MDIVVRKSIVNPSGWLYIPLHANEYASQTHHFQWLNLTNLDMAQRSDLNLNGEEIQNKGLLVLSMEWGNDPQ